MGDRTFRRPGVNSIPPPSTRNAMDLMPRMPPPTSEHQIPSNTSDISGLETTVDFDQLEPPTVFNEPTRKISSDATMASWLKSPALSFLMSFIIAINNELIRAPIPKNPVPLTTGSFTDSLLTLLSTLESWIQEFPPQDQSLQRFGNKAFKLWVEKLEENAASLISSLLPVSSHDAVLELEPYLVGAFGHKTRLDYGSGHELSFVCFLCCLRRLHIITPSDMRDVALRVLPRYFELARALQTTYTLEPAGSHGVWGLDDHQFLCYYWGAAQLIGHQHLKPKSVLQPEVVDACAKEYMYLRAIQFIYQVKRGPFHEHSPLLYDISGVPTWAKVNSGMLKMYLAEVIKKFPVVQHIPFGSLLPFSPSPGAQ